MAAAVALLAVVSLGALAAVPAAANLDRAAPAARHLATCLLALRFRAVAANRTLGLEFERDAEGWFWWQVEDGNGNGLRSAELGSGIDRRTGGPFRLERIVEHARLGFPPAVSIPRVPPGAGALDLSDPIQFGRSDLVSFGPLGTASSGTLYLTDGRHRLYGVVLYGRSARVRVWRFDTREGRWKL